MPTVLVTGADGFTASHLIPELRRRQYEVVGIARHEHAPEQGVHACDLLDHDALAGIVETAMPELVVHLAAVSHVSADARATYETNILGTRNLLRALAEGTRTPSLVLLASSGAVYGAADVDPIHEDVPPRPESDYAVSKLAMEHMARLWRRLLPITIVRPFNYTGAGQSTELVVPKIVAHFRRGAREIELGDVDVERDFSDVRAVCEAYCRLLEVRPAGETFNVCSGTAHSLRDVLALMAEIAGYQIAVRVDPALLRPNEVRRLRGSPRKLVEQIGDWRPIPLRTTLEWMYTAEDGPLS